MSRFHCAYVKSCERPTRHVFAGLHYCHFHWHYTRLHR